MDFILVNLPIILCFVVGTGLLVLEVFLPGFGLPGISGAILEIVSIVITWMKHGPIAALGMTVVVLAVVAISISVFLKSASSGRISKSGIILRHKESPSEGYSATRDMEVFLGKEGITATALRPAGIAEFDGVRLDVISEGEFLDGNTAVRIEKVEGARIVVRPVAEKGGAASNG